MVDDNENVVDKTVSGRTSVFLAWSGSVSKKMAGLLKDQLPLLVRNIDIFMSEDTTKGKRWHSEIANALGSTKFGILCLTPENLTSEWIHFEAGALSKTIDDATHVCPLLLDVKKSELQEPLASFQATIFDKKEFKSLVKDLAQACGDSLREVQFDRLMDALWPEINKSIESLKTELAEARKESGEPDDAELEINPLLEEVVVRVREQGRILATLATEQDGADLRKELLEAVHEIKHVQNRIMNRSDMYEQRRTYNDWKKFGTMRDKRPYPYTMSEIWLSDIIIKIVPRSELMSDAENIFEFLIKNGAPKDRMFTMFGGRDGTIEAIRVWGKEYVYSLGEEES